MTDKNKKSGRVELKKAELTEEFKDMAFPTRIPEVCEFLSVVIQGAIVCNLCMDMVGNLAILHLYIIPEYKSKKTIKELVKVFYTLVHPWAFDHGATGIMVNCEIEDTKTTELFRTFGFEPKNISLAMMPIELQEE